MPGAGVPGRAKTQRSGRLRGRSRRPDDSQYHRAPLSKALGEGLFELRHVGKLNTRVLWFFMKGRRIVLLHGIRNKGQAIPARDLATARERMRDGRKRAEP